MRISIRSGDPNGVLVQQLSGGCGLRLKGFLLLAFSNFLSDKEGYRMRVSHDL